MSARAEIGSALGVHYGLPIDVYHASPGISNSGLSDFSRSPAHYFALHLDPDRPAEEETPAQLVGNLAHCAILEPDAFASRYVTLPADAPRRPSVAQWNAKNPSPESVAAMKWWRDFGAQHAGVTIIDEDKHAAAVAQAAGVRRISDVAALLATGKPEVSAFWIDPATGELCRCRPDWVHPVGSDSVILLDVKTTGNASPGDFARQAHRMRYANQADWYLAGYEIASGKKVVGFVFVVVETDWPYAAAAYMLPDEWLGIARDDNAAQLERFAECSATHKWPGYVESVQLLDMPAWVGRDV